MDWIVAVVRVPTEPSRHRVAVWRELRRAGALSLAAATWALPNTPRSADTIETIRTLIHRAPDGELLLLDVRGHDAASQDRLGERYTADREAEWTEFIADTTKFQAEITREIAKQKFTLAELEEEEQSLDRLRRWHRDISLRDLFGAPSASPAAIALNDSTAHLEEFAERVYQALGH